MKAAVRAVLADRLERSRADLAEVARRLGAEGYEGRAELLSGLAMQVSRLRFEVLSPEEDGSDGVPPHLVKASGPGVVSVAEWDRIGERGRASA